MILLNDSQHFGALKSAQKKNFIVEALKSGKPKYVNEFLLDFLVVINKICGFTKHHIWNRFKAILRYHTPALRHKWNIVAQRGFVQSSRYFFSACKKLGPIDQNNPTNIIDI